MSENFTLDASDLRGFTRMIKDAGINITDLVEDMQRRIVHPAYLPSTPIQHMITGIAGLTFKSTKLGFRIFGGGLDKIFGLLHPVIGESLPSREKEFLVAILNGVVGDYLENTDNPLSIPMQFRCQGNRIEMDVKNIKNAYPDINGKILLMVHGLCMNDFKWHRHDHNHGEKLADELNYTTVYLKYNGGRHISNNGKDLNTHLEELVRCWPIPVEELHIVAHSMGGLVTRSAFHYGSQEKKTWTKHLNKIVFLGTPHHGAPLERTGNYLDFLMDSAPYVKPFARLNKIRSAGITDLRYGNLIDEDWKGIDRFKKLHDKRIAIPLPQNVQSYTVAATRGNEDANLSNQIVGDGLVPLKSALGKHKKANMNLSFKESHCYISYESNHMDLLSKQEIYQQIKTWLSQ